MFDLLSLSPYITHFLVGIISALATWWLANHKSENGK